MNNFIASRPRRWAGTFIIGLTLATALAACSNENKTSNSSPVPPTDAESNPGDSAGGDSVPVCSQGGVVACLLPWPDNRLTIQDSSTSTGLRLAIPADATPVNVDGVAMDVTDQNRADGFSPNSMIVFEALDVDLVASGMPDSAHIEDSIIDSAPVTITDLSGNELIPYWGEIDVDSGLVTLRPAISLTEGATYEVTIKALVDSSGNDIEFAEAHRQWSFTVASAESLSGRLLYERLVAYQQIGDGVPVFTVDTVTPGDVLTIEGTLEIPNFLDNDGRPGGKLLLDDANVPMINEQFPKYRAAYRCVVPDNVSNPVPALLYGHGLLGSRSQVDFFASFAAQGQITGCAVDWLGMASEDLGNLAGILADMSRFNEQADRMLQGHVAFQMLGRLTNSPLGFVTNQVFQNDDGSPVLEPNATVFVGNSQGGILGGAATAISTEWKRAVLGVPGINYSLLLPRSSDWPQFQAIFDQAYLVPAERIMVLALVQLLWDRGENGGYAQHLTTQPYAGFQTKEVLLVEAFGDHQVANVSTEILARTIGARVHSPVIAAGRSASANPMWGIETIESYPYGGSALVLWDFGTPAPPIGANRPTDPEYGTDPHGAGSDEPLVLVQALGFLLGGQLQNVCGAGPCIGTAIDQVE